MINLIYTILPIVSFIIGFSFGFTIKRDDKLPEFKSPKQVIEQKKTEKKIEQKKKVLDQYLESIANCPSYQKDIKE